MDRSFDFSANEATASRQLRGPGLTDVFDRTTAETSVWLSATAYCNVGALLTRDYNGSAVGFQAKYVIDARSKDVQCAESTIYVVFRGSSSVLDWINNLNADLVSYPRCIGCQVHAGFYDAEQTVIVDIENKVMALREIYNITSIVLTGHSLGAAIATLTAVDLISDGFQNVRLFHFGGPRVGNTAFATFASNTIADRNRVTHYKDVVPHLPSSQDSFTHISGEWYENQDHMIQDCVGFEDPTCADQWPFYEWSTDSHLVYLGLPVNCEAVS